jgi:hypothetical protein
MAASRSASAGPATATYSQGEQAHHDDRSRLAHLDISGDRAVTHAEKFKRVYAEGRGAEVGEANSCRGQMVLAAVWLGGHRRMLGAVHRIGCCLLLIPRQITPKLGRSNISMSRYRRGLDTNPAAARPVLFLDLKASRPR